MEITGIVIAKNEADHIIPVVENLFEVCDGVIVVDSGSLDETTTFAEKAGAKVVFHEWEGYRDQRRFADTLVKSDWVLVVDADERLSEGLMQAILKLKGRLDESDARAYAIRRNLHFMGTCFRNNYFTCEWKLRLYNRQFSEWTGGSVHENLTVTGKTGKIHETIDHYPYENLEDASEKLHRYAFLKARDKFENGKKTGFWGMVFSIKFTFIKKYLFQFRFLKGPAGLILSWLETDYTAIKYMKLYELNHFHNSVEDKKNEQ